MGHQAGIYEDLGEARWALDYFQSLKPYVSDDPEEMADVAERRRQAMEDIRERIKELEEEYGEASGPE